MPRAESCTTLTEPFRFSVLLASEEASYTTGAALNLSSRLFLDR
jgi:hypothetical protein